MSMAIWGMVLPIVALIVREVINDIKERRRIERDRDSNT